MLNDREQRIKDLLAKEMGGYQSYAEYRGIKDRIDPDFLAQREKQLKFGFYLLWTIFVVFLCVWLGIIVYALLMSKNTSLISSVFVAISSTFAVMFAYSQYHKKQMAFKVFEILAESDGVSDNKPDAHEVD